MTTCLASCGGAHRPLITAMRSVASWILPARPVLVGLVDKEIKAVCCEEIV
jgi:hypothetical protein